MKSTLGKITAVPAYIDRLTDAVAGDDAIWDSLDGCRTLVTGASGLIGSCAVDMFIRRSEISGQRFRLTLAGRSPDRIRERFTCDSGMLMVKSYDELQSSRMDTFDYIVHLASNASPAVMRSQPVETLTAGLISLYQLLGDSRASQLRRLVYVSSSEVYEARSTAAPIAESDDNWVAHRLTDRASYPSSKRLSELLCVAALSEWAVPSVIARPSYVYGPTFGAWDDRVIPQFVRSAAVAEPIRLTGTGSSIRSYCYVTDCVSGLLRLAVRGEPGLAYNVSDRHSVVSIGEVAELTAASVSVGVRKPSAASRGEVSEHRVLDASLLESLGWTSRVALAEGLAETVAIHRAVRE